MEAVGRGADRSHERGRRDWVQLRLEVCCFLPFLPSFFFCRYLPRLVSTVGYTAPTSQLWRRIEVGTPCKLN